MNVNTATNDNILTIIDVLKSKNATPFPHKDTSHHYAFFFKKEKIKWEEKDSHGN